MQVSKELMDVFYANSKTALSNEDYELAQFWSSCESMVNNLHHGKHPSIWTKELKDILKVWMLKVTDEKLLKAHYEALELISIVE